MLDKHGKPYTMMVESYWVPELKHQLVSPQYLNTEEDNPVSFQTHSRFEIEEKFTEFIVKSKVKIYHRQPALHTSTMQYNR